MKQHTVIKGETLGSVAGLYYSNPSLYLRIYKTNPFLKGRTKGDLANEDIIFPGELLIIPGAGNLPSGEILTESSDLQIEIDGETFRGWSGVTIDLNIDRIADTFSFAVAYDNVEPYNNILKRFQYQQVRIIFKTETVLTGIIPIIEITSGENSTTIIVNGYSLPGVLAGVNLPPNQYPTKFDGMSIAQIALQLCDPFGIGVIIEDAAQQQANILFDETAIGEEEFIGSYLVKLAKDRSCILSNTPGGDLLIKRIQGGAEESFSIIKPTNPERKNVARFDGTKLFSDYFLVNSGDELNDAETAVFRFPIKSYRPRVFKQKESSKQNLANKVENEAKKALAAAQQIDSSLPGWLDDKEKLIRPGSVVSIKDPALQIEQSERHILRTVTLTSSASGSRQASFSAVLEASLVPA